MEDSRPAAALGHARDVARLASQLAYEAAVLAQLIRGDATDAASVEAAQASIQAARRAFQFDDERVRPTDPDEALAHAIGASRDALDVASEAVRAARLAVDSVAALRARPAVAGFDGTEG